MIRIGILGDIGSGKSFVAKSFGYPVFNADREVSKIYKTNKFVFLKLKEALPRYIFSYPISKSEISNAILASNKNLEKIIKIVHAEVKKKMNFFLNKNKNKKIIILDIPLILENKLNNKNDILIFVDSNKIKILEKLKKRKNFNLELFKKFKKIQLSSNRKKSKAKFIIKNDFTKKTVKRSIKKILNDIL